MELHSKTEDILNNYLALPPPSSTIQTAPLRPENYEDLSTVEILQKGKILSQVAKILKGAVKARLVFVSKKKILIPEILYIIIILWRVKPVLIKD